MRARAVVAPLAAAVAILAGCTGSTSKSLPPAPAVDETTTTAPDLTQVAVAGVSGRATTTIDTRPGGATVDGTVAAGLDGPVGAATVRVQRLAGDAVVETDVVTAADGSWSLPNVQGGRYRIRAWRAPDLALVDPVVVFLGATETRHVPISLSRYTGLTAVASIAPSPPPVGQPANLVVQARSQMVDSDGVVRATPIAGATLQLTGSGSWTASPNSIQTADGQGSARWRVECRDPGTQPLSVTVNGSDTLPLSLPACTEPVTTTIGTTTTTSA